MKNLLLFLFLLPVSVCSGQEIRQRQLKVDLCDVRVVKIMASGKTILKANRDDAPNQLSVQSHMEVKGKSYALFHGSKKKPFEFEQARVSDTLLLTLPQRSLYWIVFGSSNKRDEITNSISLPADKEIMLIGGERVELANGFKDLKIERSKNIWSEQLWSDRIGTLMISAGQKLKINGKESQNQYLQKGLGNQQMHLVGDQIELMIIDKLN